MSADIISALTFVVRLSYVCIYIPRSLRFASSSMQNASKHRINANIFVEKLREGMCVSLDKQHLFANLSDRDIIDSRLNNKFARFAGIYLARKLFAFDVADRNLLETFCENIK